MFLAYSIALGVVNLVYGIYYYEDGYFQWEKDIYKFNLEPADIIIYVATFTVFVIFLSLVGHVFKRRLYSNNKETVGVICPDRMWGEVSSLLMVMSIISIVLNYVYSANIAGKQNSIDVPNLVKFLTIMLNSDYLVPFFLCFKFRNIKKYMSLSVLCLIDYVVKGWMGGLFVIIISWIINYNYMPNCWPVKTKKYLFRLLIFVLIATPILLFLKHQVRNENGIDVSFLSSLSEYFDLYDIKDIYYDAFYSFFARLLTIDAYALYLDHFNVISNSYLSGSVTAYYQENMLSAALGMNANSIPFGQYLAGIYVNDDVAWATHPTYLGWFAVGGLAFLSYTLILTLANLYIASLFRSLALIELIQFLSVMFLWHGWISAYINIAIYLTLLLFIVSVYRLRAKV